ncbi:uncharacterized protein V6R79_001615 [Siganus canaliculatus]
MATLDAADSPGELAHMLNKAYKKIANLDLADRRGRSAEQHLRARANSPLGPVLLLGTPWTEVVIRGRKRAPSGAHGGAPSPLLPLTNKYAALSEKPATRDLHQQTSPVPAATDTLPPLTDTTAFPPLAATCPPAGGCPARSRPPEPTRPSSQRKRLVRDAVRWHSSRSPRPARDHTRSPGVAELARSPEDRADAPKTLLIGDSIVRNVRMRGAVTMSFPGATVAEVMRKTSDILSSHPQLKRIIIHAGTNDIARQQSELLKQDFRDLFNSISQSQVTVFISGPTPTCGRGIGSFSRLLSLNTWLSSACSSHHVGFINNFDLFWERRHLFGPDGLHLNRAGARMLSGNLAYGIQHVFIYDSAEPQVLVCVVLSRFSFTSITCRKKMLRLRTAAYQSWRGFKTFPCAAVEVKNEPILGFKEGSAERKDLLKALDGLKGKTEEIPCVVGDEHVWTKDIRYQLSPFNHSHKVAKFCYADKELINKAILASVAARKEWDLRPVQDRAQVLFKAADAISGPKRAEILAKTMIGQGKTVVQAEIDAAAELIDFFRFNAKHAIELETQQPLDADGSTNTMLYRGLEGFVAAVAPFNFTAIGGNLAGTPALMGNVVLWKPSDTAMSASYAVYKVLRECGLPPNIVQFLPADGPVFGDAVTSSPHLAGINFTGSVPTFKRLWKQVAQNLDTYKTFPRLAGECGGKNFHFVHKSADVESVVKGTIRSAFEYGGQKCSACSRMYVPDSMWPQIKKELLDIHKHIVVADPVDNFNSFFSAVIDDKSFARIKKWLDHAKSSPNLKVVAGGNCDDSKGYFVEPTIIETSDPQDAIMNEEIFGPVLSVYVYPENSYKEVLQLIDNTSPYALTGAVFAQDKTVINEAAKALRNAAGNYYVNDKSTGSIVAQQPFGGARASGTNDKPGGPHYVLRWTSPQVVKETHVPLTDWKYPYMG